VPQRDRVATGDSVDEHLHEQRMIEVLPQLHQVRRPLPGRLAGPRNVLDVLSAAGIAAPRRGGEHGRSANPVVPHGRDGILDERFPISVAEIDGQRVAALNELGLQRGDQLAIDAVDRRDTAEVQIVLGHIGEPFPRDAAAASDVLQERHYLLGTLRPAERQQQDGVKIHYNNCVLAPPSA
jgi:hypothetical protein